MYNTHTLTHTHTHIHSQVRVLMMDSDTKAITPATYEGVSVVSFGFAGQGSAIMRGPMVSGTCFVCNVIVIIVLPVYMLCGWSVHM